MLKDEAGVVVAVLGAGGSVVVVAEANAMVVVVVGSVVVVADLVGEVGVGLGVGADVVVVTGAPVVVLVLVEPSSLSSSLSMRSAPKGLARRVRWFVSFRFARLRDNGGEALPTRCPHVRRAGSCPGPSAHACTQRAGDRWFW